MSHVAHVILLLLLIGLPAISSAARLSHGRNEHDTLTPIARALTYASTLSSASSKIALPSPPTARPNDPNSQSRATADDKHTANSISDRFSRLRSQADIIVTLNPDATWSNATFSEYLCGNLTIETEALTVLVADPSLLFAMPPCFYSSVSASLTSLTLYRVIIAGELGDPDPLARVGARSQALVTVTLKFCSLQDADGLAYVADWASIFEAMSSVSQMTISDSHLQGSLPGAIPTILTNLVLSSNDLTGTMPSSMTSNFGGQKLTEFLLSFDNNKIEGSILDVVFRTLDFSAMRTFVFDASHNQFTGSIPPDIFTSSGTVFKALTSAFTFRVASNNLDGEIEPVLTPDLFPHSFGSFDVSLSFNRFTGAFPLAWQTFNWTTCFSFSLDLFHNGLTGDTPYRAWNIPFTSALQSWSMNIGSNKLSGSITPDLTAIGDTSSMVFFSLIASSNKITGGLPNALITNLAFNSATYVTFDFSVNQLTGDLPDKIFNKQPEKLAVLLFDVSENPTLSGTIPSSFLASINYGGSSTTTMVSASITLNIFNSPVTGTLEIPDCSHYVAYQPLQLNINAADCALDYLYIAPQSSKCLSTLDLSRNVNLNGTIPSEVLDTNAVLLTLLAPNTKLSGLMPDLGTLGAPRMTKIDLSFTAIDFCSDKRSVWTLAIDCNLMSTSARGCKELYPSCDATGAPDFALPSPGSPTLSPTSTPSPQLAPTPILSPPSPLIPTSPTTEPDPRVVIPGNEPSTPTEPIPPSSNPSALAQPPSTASCPESTRPSIEFVCIDGKWTTTTTISAPVLTIPSGAGQTIVQNLTSPAIVFHGIGSMLVITGCATNLTLVTVELTQEELVKIGSTKTQDLVTASSNCTNLDAVALETKVNGKGCRRVKTDKTVQDGTLTALFVVKSSSCNTWWIILVSVICAVVVVAVVIIAIVIHFQTAGKFKQSVASVSD